MNSLISCLALPVAHHGINARLNAHHWRNATTNKYINLPFTKRPMIRVTLAPENKTDATQNSNQTQKADVYNLHGEIDPDRAGPSLHGLPARPPDRSVCRPSSHSAPFRLLSAFDALLAHRSVCVTSLSKSSFFRHKVGTNRNSIFSRSSQA